MSWFKDWFDTPYYYLLYRHRNEAEAEQFMRNLLAYLNLPPDSRFLDLACGKGRHARFLAKQGYDVTGIDLSEASIAQAMLLENEKLHFYVHDMREVFRTNTFDVVVNLFTSFGYFDNTDDNLRALQAVHTALQPNGILIIDFLNAPRTIAQLRPHEWQVIEGIQFELKRKVENNFIVKTIDIADRKKRLSFVERVQALTYSDFLVYFEKAGFEVVKVWGNYNLDPYHQEKSDRLIMVVKKSAV